MKIYRPSSLFIGISLVVWGIMAFIATHPWNGVTLGIIGALYVANAVWKRP